MDFSAMRTFIKGRLETTLTDTEIDQHINEAYRDFSQLFTPDTPKEDATLATVNGQAEYTLGAESRRILEVHVNLAGGRDRLRSVRYAALVYPRLSGQPARWYPMGMTESGNNVRQRFGLDPIPNATYAALTIYAVYEPEPADLVNTTDIPKYVPEELHDVLAWGGLSLTALADKRYSVAQAWGGQYIEKYNATAQKLGRTAASNFPDLAKLAGQAQ